MTVQFLTCSERPQPVVTNTGEGQSKWCECLVHLKLKAQLQTLTGLCVCLFSVDNNSQTGRSLTRKILKQFVCAA